MKKVGDVTVFDFDEGMPEALRQAVLATEACRRYLSERERIGAIVAARADAGLPPTDDALHGEIAALEALVHALRAVIDRCRAAQP